MIVLLGQRPDDGQGLVEIAVDGDDPSTGHERLEQLADGDLALRQDDDDDDGEQEEQASQWIQELRRFAPSLPDDVRRREHVMRVVREVYERYGFEPLETPAFENIETLLGKYGEEGNKLIFKILRRGEHHRRVVRPDR